MSPCFSPRSPLLVPQGPPRYATRNWCSFPSAWWVSASWTSTPSDTMRMHHEWWKRVGDILLGIPGISLDIVITMIYIYISKAYYKHNSVCIVLAAEILRISLGLCCFFSKWWVQPWDFLAKAGVHGTVLEVQVADQGKGSWEDLRTYHQLGRRRALRLRASG